ncbi:MAG: thiamine phosphate synthase [Coxiellaceae bacterium]|nr:thiamine phosphate synthase [Coxiellaceae bacterium]
MKSAIDWQQALKCCLVIGPSCGVKHSWIDTIQLAIQGGITSIQLREKNASEAEMARMAKQLLKLLPSHIPLIINDHVDVAKQLQCAAHIGQSDMPFVEARRLLGTQSVTGLSIENLEQARQYKNCGATYFGVGPVFTTGSKPDAAEALGINKTIQIIELLDPTPCVLIGGIDKTNVHHLPPQKSGIAVISAITQAISPLLATQQLLKALT